MARPREFDIETVLDKAAEVFWNKGFEATSIQDLVMHLGIGRGSLYAAFGDKQGLFLASLERYGEKLVNVLIGELESQPSLLDSLRGFFIMLVQHSVNKHGPFKGCLLTNSAVERSLNDPKTAAIVQALIQKITLAFAITLSKGQQQGEIAKNRNVDQLAGFLTCVMQGLLVLARVSPDEKHLNNIVESTLTLVT